MPNTGDVTLYGVDEILMGSHIGGNEAEIISINQSDIRDGFGFDVKFLIILFVNAFKLLQHRIYQHGGNCLA